MIKHFGLNRIKTIHSSLEIEGNTLTIEQITAIVEKKRVIGPKKDILEVKNKVNYIYRLKGQNGKLLYKYRAV